MNAVKVTIDAVRAMKGRGARVAALTAYDFPTTRLLDEAGIPVILVGDSLGMVMLGYPDTTHVTLADMEHHVRAAARARPRALLGADLPAHTYDTPEQALASARRLMEAGAEFVKGEGGREICPQIRRMVEAGIPFMGHLGMLPQHLSEEGGRYRIKGRDEAGRMKLLDDARALAEAGAFAMVLELVTPPVAEEICRQSPIPALGIGSGPGCDGQILVIHDLVGTFPWFTPKHVKPLLNGAEQMREAIVKWKNGLVLR